VFVDVQAVREDEGDMAKINWTLQQFNIDELTDYYKNPRSLSDKEFKQLKTSLDKFGMIDKPIVNADSANTIIGGHQRKHVLEASGVKEIECWIPDRELSDKEVEELNIRLNKNTGSWDFDVLANEFELDDLLDWGFDKGELDLDLWAEDAPEDVEPQIDKAEELREKWGVESGQLWQLGEHRLICGDCTDRAVVERIMQGEVAGAVVTDPPYGLGNSKSFNDNHADYEDSEPFDLSQLDLSAPFVIWGGNYFGWLPVERNKIGWIVWDKRPNLEGEKRERADRIFGQHFEIAVTTIGDLRGKMYRQRWGGYYGSQEIFHKTQKPPELFEWCITSTEGLIVDYFLGSGTTLIACERLGRKCRAVEISPAYVAVAIQRWVDVTGGEPVMLESM